MAEFQPGTVLAQSYRIESKQGEGGMAVVYRAYDLQRRVMVAIKALKPDYAEDSVFVRKFRREAQNLARLNHPNIVRFYEFHSDGMLAFMVLDFIDGLTLRATLRQLQRPLSPGEALGYLRPIAAALGYAHRMGMVHCDMKPANVMIDRLGRVFVNDFGIARLSESATVTFSTPGTAAYMAPEQWRGGEDVYPATDVYALGIMLYEMLTGHQPFIGERAQTRGHTRERIMQEHLHMDPPLASQLNPQLPRAFDKILLQCLAKRPADRYQSVEALLTEFEAACGGLPTEVPVPPPVMPVMPSLPPSPAPIQPTPGGLPSGGFRTGALALGGAGVLILLGGIALTVIFVLVLALGGRNTQGAAPTQIPVTQVVEAPVNVPPTPISSGGTDTSSKIEGVTPTAVPLAAPTQPPGLAGAPRGHIVFTCFDGNDDEICLINADGSGLVHLTNNSEGDFYPSLSNDGRFIVFSHQISGSKYEIFRMDTSGSNVIQLTSNGAGNFAPAYSPDDSLIAFSYAQGGSQQIVVMTSDGTSAYQVTSEGKNEDPSWSPDGHYISYASAQADDRQLWVINADGSNPHELTSLPDMGGRSSWSPDEGTLVFYAGKKEDRSRNIYTIGVNGSNLQQLTFGEDNLGPSYSPDGGWIAFTSYRDGDNDIYIMRLDGSDVTNLTANTSSDYQPRWGP